MYVCYVCMSALCHATALHAEVLHHARRCGDPLDAQILGLTQCVYSLTT